MSVVDQNYYVSPSLFCAGLKRAKTCSRNTKEQTVRVATQYAFAPASCQYIRNYSPGGTCSGMLAI